MSKQAPAPIDVELEAVRLLASSDYYQGEIPFEQHLRNLHYMFPTTPFGAVYRRAVELKELDKELAAEMARRP